MWGLLPIALPLCKQLSCFIALWLAMKLFIMSLGYMRFRPPFHIIFEFTLFVTSELGWYHIVVFYTLIFERLTC